MFLFRITYTIILYTSNTSLKPELRNKHNEHRTRVAFKCKRQSFEIRTVQSAAFRTLIEALKEILTEANLEFDSTGIKVIDVDETHTVLTYLRLNADRFEYFYCPAKYVLGINMIYLFKLIKTLSNNDSLTLFLPAANPNKLGIRAENAEKGTTNKMDDETIRYERRKY